MDCPQKIRGKDDDINTDEEDVAKISSAPA